MLTSGTLQQMSVYYRSMLKTKSFPYFFYEPADYSYFMPVRVICFFQPGCMGCMEQSLINREVEKKMDVTIEEIDVVKNPQFIQQYGLKVTPTIIILDKDVVKERLEGVVQAEQLEATLEKYP